MIEKGKVYQRIGSARLLDIKVIKDDTEVIYEGRLEEAPEEIKNMKYSRVDTGKIMVYYVYSEYMYK